MLTTKVSFSLLRYTLYYCRFSLFKNIYSAVELKFTFDKVSEKVLFSYITNPLFSCMKVSINLEWETKHSSISREYSSHLRFVGGIILIFAGKL